MTAAHDLWEGDTRVTDPATNNHHPDPVLAAERAVLGAALLQPTLIPELAAILRDDDWSHLGHQAIWIAITDRAATGRPVDPLSLAHDIADDRAVKGLGGGPYLHTLIADPAVLPSSATYHAEIVAEAAQARRTEALGTWVVQAARSGLDDETVRNRLEKHLSDRNPAARRGADIPTLDELLAQDEDDEPAWIIPGLLERQDRLIITATEGAGKSTLLRQIAIMCAAGLHPFTGNFMDPVNVMYVDLENSKRQVRRKIRALRLQAGPHYDDQRLRFEVRIQGLDLTQHTDVTWLDQAVGRYKPDLLITGPVYKLANGDPTKEESSKPVALAIDRIRAEHDVAVILEAHSAKAPAGVKHRPKEPYGWSGWLRWPEFGLHLADDGELTHWRGARDERDWPELLLRGGHWPWMPAQTTVDQRWAQIHQCLTAAGERLSNREIGRRTGLDDRTVRRLLERNSRRYAALLERFGERPDDDETVPIESPEQQGFNDA